MNFEILNEICAHAVDNARRINGLGDMVEGSQPECDQAALIKHDASNLVGLCLEIKTALIAQSDAIFRLERNIAPMTTTAAAQAVGRG